MLDKVYVIGYYGYGSLGDEAMRIGLDHIIRFKGYENLRFHNKGQGYLRNFLWSDVVVLGGGTHLRDWGKGWFKQSLRILLLGCVTRLSGKKFDMLNVGIDGKSLEFIAHSISNKLTLREIDTFDSSAVIEYEPRIRKKVLGVSLAPIYEAYYNDKCSDLKIAVSVAKKITKWLKNNPEWTIRFYNFNLIDEELNKFCAELLNESEFRYYTNDVQLVLSDMSECGAFIGMRYHANQFAYMTRTPMLVINSYMSCRNLADFIGVNYVELHDVLTSNYELNFKEPSLSIINAKTLAIKGVEL